MDTVSGGCDVVVRLAGGVHVMVVPVAESPCEEHQIDWTADLQK